MKPTFRHNHLILSTLLISIQGTTAGEVTFIGGLDMDSDTNTSSAEIPYNATAAALQNPAGIPDETVSMFTGTYFFADLRAAVDGGTGLAYSFDLTWTSTGGMLNSAIVNGSSAVIGVGGNALLDPGETISVELSNLVVDASGYINGSVDGLIGPVSVLSTGLGFDRVAGQLRAEATNISVAINGGAAAPIGGATLNAATGILPVNLGDTGVEYTFSDPVDGTYRLNLARISTVIELDGTTPAADLELEALSFDTNTGTFNVRAEGLSSGTDYHFEGFNEGTGLFEALPTSTFTASASTEDVPLTSLGTLALVRVVEGAAP